MGPGYTSALPFPLAPPASAQRINPDGDRTIMAAQSDRPSSLAQAPRARRAWVRWVFRCFARRAVGEDLCLAAGAQGAAEATMMTAGQ